MSVCLGSLCTARALLAVSVHPPCEDADVRGWIGGCCESAIKTFSSMMGV